MPMSTPHVRIEFATVASSYGAGPFHPALRTGKDCMYWPTITFHTEDEACGFAAKALEEAYDAATAVAEQWNVCEAI